MDFGDLPEELQAKLGTLRGGGEAAAKHAMVREALSEQNRFVEKYIGDNKIKLYLNGTISWASEPNIDQSRLIIKMYQDYRIWAHDRGIPKSQQMNKSDVGDQLNLCFFEIHSEEIRTIHNKVRFDERWDDGGAELKKFIKAMLPGSTSKKQHFAQKIVECFIWQTKRKLGNQSVHGHIMPVFYSSKHGTGKSTSVDLLLGPLKNFRMDLQLGVFKDPFIRKAFSQNYVVVFDEMQGAGKADIEGMKNAITASTLSARAMHSQNMDTIQQNCTFIGTSNRKITELIFDPTGMRRFAEIEFEGQFDLDAMREIDFIQVWRSVREDATNPADAIREELVEHQETIRLFSPVEAWMDEYELEGGEKEIPINTLYNHYKQWAESQRKDAGYKQSFCRELKRLGILPLGRKDVKGQKVAVYGVNLIPGKEV